MSYEIAKKLLRPYLRSCPFCGAIPYPYDGDNNAYVACSKCGARGGSFSWVKYRLPISECQIATTAGILAANAWNRRPEDVASPNCPKCGVSVPHTHQPEDRFGTIIIDLTN
jgi:hypothetical protein